MDHNALHSKEHLICNHGYFLKKIIEICWGAALDSSLVTPWQEYNIINTISWLKCDMRWVDIIYIWFLIITCYCLKPDVFTGKNHSRMLTLFIDLCTRIGLQAQVVDVLLPSQQRWRIQRRCYTCYCCLHELCHHLVWCRPRLLAPDEALHYYWHSHSSGLHLVLWHWHGPAGIYNVHKHGQIKIVIIKHKHRVWNLPNDH